MLEKIRGFIQRNAYSSYRHTIANVHEELCKCKILEENIIVPYSKLEESTDILDTGNHGEKAIQGEGPDSYF